MYRLYSVDTYNITMDELRLWSPVGWPARLTIFPIWNSSRRWRQSWTSTFTTKFNNIASFFFVSGHLSLHGARNDRSRRRRWDFMKRNSLVLYERQPHPWSKWCRQFSRQIARRLIVELFVVRNALLLVSVQKYRQFFTTKSSGNEHLTICREERPNLLLSFWVGHIEWIVLQQCHFYSF